MKKFGPTNGWKRLGRGVYEHTNNARIHRLGVIRLPDMTFISLHSCKAECQRGRQLIKINGGNRKRGLMAWAIELSTPVSQ